MTDAIRIIIITLLSCCFASAATPNLPAPVATAIAADIAKDLAAGGIKSDTLVAVSGYAALPIAASASIPVVPTQDLVLCPANGVNATVWDQAVSGRVLQNIIYDSSDGKGFLGNVRGDKVTIGNVDMKNLNEGFHLSSCTNLTINGGGQIGNVLGRCYLFEDVTNLTWNGDPAKTFGHATTQSPIRFDSPGVKGGTVSNVRITQVGSSFPIACAAIHCASNVKFVNCSATGGEWSLNSAGSGTGDAVKDCTFQNLTVTNSKLDVEIIASNNTFTGGAFTNPAGECVSLACGPGNVFDGLVLHTGKAHGFHFYSASNAIIENCTVYGPKGVVVMDGACTPKNDGGGNKVIIVP